MVRKPVFRVSDQSPNRAIQHFSFRKCIISSELQNQRCRSAAQPIRTLDFAYMPKAGSHTTGFSSYLVHAFQMLSTHFQLYSLHQQLFLFHKYMYILFRLEPRRDKTCLWVSDITETSPYKSDPRFPPKHIVKMGEIWCRNQNDKMDNFSFSP